MPLDLLLALGALLLAVFAAFTISVAVGMVLGRLSPPDPPRARVGRASRPAQRLEG